MKSIINFVKKPGNWPVIGALGWAATSFANIVNYASGPNVMNLSHDYASQEIEMNFNQDRVNLGYFSFWGPERTYVTSLGEVGRLLTPFVEFERDQYVILPDHSIVTLKEDIFTISDYMETKAIPSEASEAYYTYDPETETYIKQETFPEGLESFLTQESIYEYGDSIREEIRTKRAEMDVAREENYINTAEIESRYKDRIEDVGHDFLSQPSSK